MNCCSRLAPGILDGFGDREVIDPLAPRKLFDCYGNKVIGGDDGGDKSQGTEILVVGADILFSFFKKDSAERRLIVESPNRGCRLVTPESAMEEPVSGKERVMEVAGTDESEFESLLSLLKVRLRRSQGHSMKFSPMLKNLCEAENDSC